MQRSLKVALIIAGAIPLILGIMNLIGGARAPWLPGDIATPSLDNQLRFYAVWFMAPFFLCIWIVRNLSTALPVAIILFSTMFLGGLARLFSITQYGLPDPSMIVAMAIEIGFVLFIPWIAWAQREQAQPAAAK
ncbi:MAG: DUF4345 domain-containing protein [Pseudomonadota bacterium]